MEKERFCVSFNIRQSRIYSVVRRANITASRRRLVAPRPAEPDISRGAERRISNTAQAVYFERTHSVRISSERQAF